MEEKQLENNSLILQRILACPSCNNSLSIGNSDITCKYCGKVYSIENRIYRMITNEDLNDFEREQELVFDKIYDGYDKYLYSQPFYVSIKNDYVYPYWFQNNFKDKIVLDIGCGTGWGGEKIIGQCKLLVNLDISMNNLRLAREKFGDKNTIYIQGNMKRLPFNINSVDIITCFWALHHLEDPAITAQDISRVLNDRGIFLGIEPNIRYTWVDFWSDLLHFPVFLKGFAKDLHKKIQKITKKRLEKEEWYMRGVELKEDHHAGVRTPEEIKGYFRNARMKAESLDIGLEIVPPRFFMSKNISLVNSLLKLSDWCIKNFKKEGKGIFYTIKAYK